MLPLNVFIYELCLFQKTYAQVPTSGESHLNLMNTLDFNLSVKINSTGFYQSDELNPNSNLILHNLRSGQEYILTIQMKKETNSNEKSCSQVFVFNATSEKVYVSFELFLNKQKNC